MRARVRKWGNSSAVRIPAPVLHASHLRPNELVDIREEAGRIVIEPVRKNAYDLNELVSRITSKNRHAAIDIGPAVGNEVW